MWPAIGLGKRALFSPTHEMLCRRQKCWICKILAQSFSWPSSNVWLNSNDKVEALSSFTLLRTMAMVISTCFSNLWVIMALEATQPHKFSCRVTIEQ